MSICNEIRASSFVVATLLGVLLSGCGDDEIATIYPVKGRVLQNAEPLKVKTGYVLLKPDTEKGNNTEFELAGTIDVNGNYVLSFSGFCAVFESRKQMHPGKAQTYNLWFRSSLD